MPLTNNQNVSQIQQTLFELQSEVKAIPLMLTAFDTRVSRLEQRVEKIEEQGRASLQWSNDAHALIIREMTNSLQEIEQRIMDKLSERDTELKATEIRMNAKMDESSRDKSGRKFNFLLTLGGWLLAIVSLAVNVLLFLISYLHPH